MSMTALAAGVPAPPQPSPASLRALALNADGLPISTFPPSVWPWQEAVRAVCRGRVEVLDVWPGAVVRSPSVRMEMPRVVMLREYAPPPARLPLNRLLVALRDRFCCQYCGRQFPLRELTFDHVVPRSRGGRSTWDNLVMACGGPGGCNARKADQAANHSGRKGVTDGQFRPLRPPRMPDPMQLQQIGLDFIPHEIRSVFADWLPAPSPRATAMSAPELGLRCGWTSDAYWTVELEP